MDRRAASGVLEFCAKVAWELARVGARCPTAASRRRELGFTPGGTGVAVDLDGHPGSTSG
jgi:hypothetical protein